LRGVTEGHASDANENYEPTWSVMRDNDERQEDEEDEE
jgi:hypothetical protein